MLLKIIKACVLGTARLFPGSANRPKQVDVPEEEAAMLIRRGQAVKVREEKASGHGVGGEE